MFTLKLAVRRHKKAKRRKSEPAAINEQRATHARARIKKSPAATLLSLRNPSCAQYFPNRANARHYVVPSPSFSPSFLLSSRSLSPTLAGRPLASARRGKRTKRSSGSTGVARIKERKRAAESAQRKHKTLVGAPAAESRHSRKSRCRRGRACLHLSKPARASPRQRLALEQDGARALS